MEIRHLLSGGSGGGSGSGLAILLLMKMTDNYPDKLQATFGVYPSPKVSDVVVLITPCNAILSIDESIGIGIDYEPLYNISHNILEQVIVVILEEKNYANDAIAKD